MGLPNPLTPVIIPQEVSDALKKFLDEAWAIFQSFAKTVEAQAPPPIIYHYTNDVGLKGILESGQFHLTDIFKLNDPSELLHSFDIALEILDAEADNSPLEIGNIAKTLALLKLQGGIQKSVNSFILSFSSCGNDLGQWRAYADNGHGYALGFDTKALLDSYDENSAVKMRAFHIKYADDQLREIHRKIIAKLPLNFPAYRKQVCAALATRLLNAGLIFKHEAYSNEREYRFWQPHTEDTPVPGLRLKARPYSLVEYREYDWRSVAPAALKKIIVGPAADKQKAHLFAEDCLRSFHKGDVEIVFSGIPYRGPRHHPCSSL